MVPCYSANNTISVWNNGKGIPVVVHKEENMYVPTMIFGHLLTSSNYDDEEEKVTGGRNGYGAKLCNIFSHRFTVETATKEYKKSLKQVSIIHQCFYFLFFFFSSISNICPVCRHGAITWEKLVNLELRNTMVRISRKLRFRQTCRSS